ncbi:hypothetical protein [Roseateles chitinivorans]|uniref:hypothetical protein n=1 Tax=Roseateles chitinivorans TaxID=2917965 RepID=UPI003D673AB3
MPFRPLHDELLEYTGGALFDDVLIPWLQTNASDVEWLRAFGQRANRLIPAATDEDLWRLYAVSRVIDLLMRRFQTAQADGSEGTGLAVSHDEFKRFAQAIGLDVVQPQRYSPFHHEIVGLIRSGDGAQSVRILGQHWPCLMLGPLLFLRAGVTVSAGTRVLRPDIADKSKLYWTYHREARPHEDLSHGWGHNSSWRTCFRRDYLLDGTFHFNVDGRDDLSEVESGTLDEYGLTVEERKELVVNRCFVVTTKDGSDLFPYDDRLSVKAE